MGVKINPFCEYLAGGTFLIDGLFKKVSHGTLTKAGEEDESWSECSTYHAVPASHIQQSRYVSHLRSRNRGAMTLLHPVRAMSQEEMLASIFGECRDNRADFLTDSGVKKIASKEPSGTTGVQPVCGRQVRRGKWPIMILLEISQHAVVEVRFL